MTKSMKKNIFCIVTLFFISLMPINRARAEDDAPMFEAVSPLKVGEKAPFEGILFSKDLAARIEAEKKTSVATKICEAQKTAAVDLTKSEFSKKLEILNIKYTSLEEKHDKIVGVKDAQIDFLREKFEPPPWYKEPAFLISVGLISGAGLAIGAAYIVNLVK